MLFQKTIIALTLGLINFHMGVTAYGSCVTPDECICVHKDIPCVLEVVVTSSNNDYSTLKILGIKFDDNAAEYDSHKVGDEITIGEKFTLNQKMLIGVWADFDKHLKKAIHLIYLQNNEYADCPFKNDLQLHKDEVISILLNHQASCRNQLISKGYIAPMDQWPPCDDIMDDTDKFTDGDNSGCSFAASSSFSNHKSFLLVVLGLGLFHLFLRRFTASRDQTRKNCPPSV